MKARKRKNIAARETRSLLRAARHRVNGLHCRWTAEASVQSISEQWSVPPSEWLLLIPPT